MKLDEREIAKSYIGNPYSCEKLNKIAYPNGCDKSQYICSNADFKTEHFELFGVTPRLNETWQYYGTDFSVYIDLKEGTIKDCRIYKARVTWSGRCCPCKATQQEIRVFRRIMDYITLAPSGEKQNA